MNAEMKPKGDLPIATEQSNPLAVRKLGRLLHYVGKKGTRVSHCVFADAPILDRVDGFGLADVKDMEFISEKQHQKNIGVVTDKGKQTALAKANAGEDTPAPVVPPGDAMIPEDLGSLTVKKLKALVDLHDLDIDVKGSKPQLIERIQACIEGKPAPVVEG